MDPFGDEEHDASDKEEQDAAAAFIAQEDSRLAGLDDDEDGFDGSKEIRCLNMFSLGWLTIKSWLRGKKTVDDFTQFLVIFSLSTQGNTQQNGMTNVQDLNGGDGEDFFTNGSGGNDQNGYGSQSEVHVSTFYRSTLKRHIFSSFMSFRSLFCNSIYC